MRRTLEDERWGWLALAVFVFTREILRRRRRKVAVIADDVFQAIGQDKAAAYVKGLLNMIEHPQYKYENMVVLVATSEGASRREIGRHRWARPMPMWNMARDGFLHLYEKSRDRSLPSKRLGGGPAETRTRRSSCIRLAGTWMRWSRDLSSARG